MQILCKILWMKLNKHWISEWIHTEKLIKMKKNQLQNFKIFSQPFASKKERAPSEKEPTKICNFTTY